MMMTLASSSSRQIDMPSSIIAVLAALAAAALVAAALAAAALVAKAVASRLGLNKKRTLPIVQ